MCFIRPLVLMGLLAVFCGGCSPTPATKSAEDISKGNEKLSDSREAEGVQDVTSEDYDKMTQVDPSLKQEAMSDFDQAIKDDPNNPEAYYARGFAQLSTNDQKLKAVDDFTKAIELKPDYARAYLMRGRAYEALGDAAKAKADRDKALELEPGID